MKKIKLALIITFLIVSDIGIYAVDISPVTNATKDTNIAPELIKIRGQIIAIIQVIGVAVASIMLIVIAIKYISSAPNEKAELKKHMIPFIIGAIMIFACVGIVEIIKQFAEGSIKV